MGLRRRRSLATDTAASQAITASAGCTAGVGVGGTWFANESVCGTGRALAMSLPTISRARDVLASLVGSLPIRQYGTQWNGEDLEELPLPPEPWMLRPDPNSTRAHIMSWTFDDLMFHGRAHWFVTSRYANGFPASFQWLPAADTTIQAMMFAGNQPVGEWTFRYQATEIPRRDIVSFWSPQEPLPKVGARGVLTAARLEQAAERFASTPTALGYLKTSGEPLTTDELADLADAWATARQTNAVASLSEGVEWVESSMDPSRLQLVEARTHADLNLARLANCPPWLVGVAVGGMTYSNVQDQTSQAVLFGALPYIETIEQTLSSPQVIPPGRIVRLDRGAWLDNPLSDRPVADTPARENA